MRTYCIEHRTPFSGLWWSKWEGNPKKKKKEGIYVCMWLNYFDIQQKLTQDYKATILQFGYLIFN